jgi:serine/threonine protein kinase
MTDYIGKTLGPYKLEAALGKGGMATVYRAYQASVKRYVAVKVMASEIASDPGFVERFEREAELIASLEHPHILPVIDYGNVDDAHYIVMRYIEGGSLDDRMRRKALTLDESSRFLAQIASALDYAHKRGVIHRDLKPNNILLDGSENAYLTDFGIARMLQSDHKLTATGSIMGTPAYMSPEQGMGTPVDARSDIYTLGVVLYEMVLNRLPFTADTPAAMIFQHVYQQPAPANQIRPDLADDIVQILNKALAKGPDQRYQSGQEMADDFSAAVSAIRGPRVKAAPSEDMQSTFVGGPLEPIVPTKTPAKPTEQQSYQTAPPTRSQQPSTPAQPPATIAAPAKRSSLPLVLGVAVVLLALLGGGIFVVNNNNVENANQTGNANLLTGTAFGRSTGTQVALLALSASATASNTPLPTATQDKTQTAVVMQMSTVNAFNAQNATGTVVAQQNGTATTVALRATQTAQAQREATSAAARNLTATSQYQMIQNTMSAQETLDALPTTTPTFTATPTRRPTNTRVPPTVPPRIQIGFTGTPDDVIVQLRNQGLLSSVTGSTVIEPFDYDLSIEEAGFDKWYRPDKATTLANFVMSAAVTWDAPEALNDCGLIFRYNSPDSGVENSSYYTVTIGRDGSYQAFARDESGYRDSPLMQDTTSVVSAQDGETNQLLVIAEESNIRFYVNGKFVGEFTDDTYQTGTVGVFASRFEGSTKLTCSFSDVWAYELEGPALSASAIESGLTSGDPDEVIATLIGAGLVDSTARLTVQEPSNEVAVKDTDSDIFIASPPLSRTLYTNFVLYTEITSHGDDTATTLGCGVYYNGEGMPENLVGVFYTRAGDYIVNVRKDGTWNHGNIDSGNSEAIVQGTDSANSLVLIVKNDQATLYINGQEISSASQTDLTSGVIGYYIEKASEGGAERCSYTNTTVWRLP